MDACTQFKEKAKGKGETLASGQSALNNDSVVSINTKLPPGNTVRPDSVSTMPL